MILALFSQRLIHCLHHACYNSSYKNDCMKLMDCGGHENSVVRIGSNPSHNSWKENPNASACFTSDGFSYGIYTQAVNLTGENIIIRYTYSLVWGIQVCNQWCLMYIVLTFSSIYYYLTGFFL